MYKERKKFIIIFQIQINRISGTEKDQRPVAPTFNKADPLHLCKLHTILLANKVMTGFKKATKPTWSIHSIRALIFYTIRD